jgi:hypothetical protein
VVGERKLVKSLEDVIGKYDNAVEYEAIKRREADSAQAMYRNAVAEREKAEQEMLKVLETSGIARVVAKDLEAKRQLAEHRAKEDRSHQ